jgi:membrane-associated phospholipid phosphatase
VLVSTRGILPDLHGPILRPVLGRLKRLDLRLLRAMRTSHHSPEGEAAMRALGYAGEWGAIWVAIGFAGAAVDPRRRGRWLRATAVAPAAIGLNYAVKAAVRRRRPRLRRLPPLAGAPSELSFPSAHATSSLAAATAMGRVSPAARLPLYGLAGAICLTRPYLGMHYPSDVIAGAALGAVLGALWPGQRAKGPEDRLIDLVANAARSATASGDGTRSARPDPASPPAPGMRGRGEAATS